jgi:hypothetical protein
VPITDPPENSQGQAASPDSIVNLHLYEYQALTNRITYLITMLYALWPVTLTAIGLAALQWSPNHRALVEWTVLLLCEILAVAFYFTSCEIYTHVLYLETDLKPRLAKFTSYSEFWGWESWLKNFHGGLHSSRWLPLWELWPSLCVAIGVWWVSVTTQRPWSRGDEVGFATAGVGLVPIVSLSIRLMRIRAHRA